MENYFTFLGQLIKKNYQILYSLFLIIFIPLALFLHTYFLVKQMRSNMDLELQNKAIMVENSLEVAIVDNFREDSIQRKIDKLVEITPEIRALKIVIPQGEKFRIIASKNKTEKGKEVRELQYTLAWEREEGIAALLVEGKERFWEVSKVLKNEKGEKLGLIIMELSLTNIDKLTQHTIFQAYFWLVVVIIIVILLVANHARLFQYISLYQRLKEVDKMKDEFISIASHELRSPLISIKWYIDDAIGQLTKDKVSNNLLKSLRIISVSAERLNDLVNDLLDVARIQQKRVKLSIQPVDVGMMIKEILQEFNPQAKRKGLYLVYKSDQEKIFVLADPEKLKQVLINLVSNAIKFTFKGGVTISAKVINRKEVRIKVKDTGIGLSAEEQKKLFQKFGKVRTKETSDIPGTGLGLWISKQLIKMMKGKILLESMKGVGSQFIICLPLADKIIHKQNKDG